MVVTNEKGCRSMKYKAKTIDITYDATFAKLAPNIVGSSMNVVACLISSIGVRYPITAENVRVFPSSVLSEVKIQVDLFKGAGRLEVYADRFKGTFKNASGKEDVQTIEDCLALAIDGLREASPALAFESDNILVSAHLDLQPDGKNDRWSVDNYASAALADKLRTPELGILTGQKMVLISEEQHWRVAFDISPTWIDPQKGLFVTHQTFFYAGCLIQTMQDKSAHISGTLNQLLAAFDLSPTSE